MLSPKSSLAGKLRPRLAGSKLSANRPCGGALLLNMEYCIPGVTAAVALPVHVAPLGVVDDADDVPAAAAAAPAAVAFGLVLRLAWRR